MSVRVGDLKHGYFFTKCQESLKTAPVSSSNAITATEEYEEDIGAVSGEDKNSVLFKDEWVWNDPKDVFNKMKVN